MPIDLPAPAGVALEAADANDTEAFLACAGRGAVVDDRAGSFAVRRRSASAATAG